MLTGVAVSSSVLTIAVLSTDRLLAVRRPLSFSVYRASRHAWIIVAGVWAASLAVAAPLLHVRRLDTVNLGFGTQSKFSFCHEANYCYSRHVIIMHFIHNGGAMEPCVCLALSILPYPPSLMAFILRLVCVQRSFIICCDHHAHLKTIELRSTV